MIASLFQRIDPDLFSDSKWRQYQWSIGLPLIAICISSFFLLPKIARRALISEAGGIYWLTLFDIAILFLGIIACIAFLVRVALEHRALAQKQRTFISSVSHELRTPLTTLRMYSEMLAAGRFESEEKRKLCFNYLQKETERMHRLVENVLSVSLTNDQGQTVEVEIYTVDQILAHLKDTLEGVVELSRFTLRVKMKESLNDEKILINTDALTQIFVNLIDNSLKYAAEAEKREIVISTHCSPSNKHLLFSVRDYGPGFQKEEEKEILRPFSRGRSQQVLSKPGTGLGLALANRLTIMMKGTLSIENRNPGFSTTLQFPRYQA